MMMLTYQVTSSPSECADEGESNAHDLRKGDHHTSTNSNSSSFPDYRILSADVYYDAQEVHTKVTRTLHGNYYKN